MSLELEIDFFRRVKLENCTHPDEVKEMAAWLSIARFGSNKLKCPFHQSLGYRDYALQAFLSKDEWKSYKKTGKLPECIDD
jgi:hypothetical protein